MQKRYAQRHDKREYADLYSTNKVDLVMSTIDSKRKTPRCDFLEGIRSLKARTMHNLIGWMVFWGAFSAT